MKLLVLLLNVLWCSYVVAADEKKSLPIAAYTLKLEPGYTQVRAVTGKVIKQHEASLSFEFSGKVQSIHFDQGEWVDTGQVIATQDTQLLEIEKLQLEAEKAKLYAQLKLAKIEQKRFEKLSKKNYSAAQQLDEVTTKIEVITAEHALLDANLQSVAVRLKKAQLVAPFSGLIAQRHVHLGEIASSGQAMVTLLEQNKSQVVLGVPMSLQHAINDTMMVAVSQAQYRVKLLSRGAQVDSVSRTLMMRFELPDDAPVYAGELARMVITTFTEQPGFWIPLSALTDGVRGTWQVYGVKDNTINSIAVNVHYTDGEYAYVSGALSEHPLIVANGLHKVAANITVEVVQTLSSRSL
ncbi:efflux RND transporter periplasmic adaptor subunit [Pseudoalteromonas citrea]|uniref:Efflux RND transporter periplasmic adaptor subunit n=1 Tax=Pseudoalteromonas citrea TaxID=43655 RepID=A0A5S3XTG3_9GAMM|nr:efflux RND transporter periplasmic adaptor subunit [Pseudoalteromonas citrea]TMP44755.1 efflux RND transporter periplasmic adaptor subunit [Pseudoalteromonas citrea]TMP61127.1 efflux RND transporter periplasmic adaptor subunit [Pseudoalteromonas citrea]